MEVSHAERVVFPEIGRTKGEVVRFVERLSDRILPHVRGRPLSIKRYPKGIAGPGFFQKNVPEHYPESIARFEVPRSREAARKHGKGAAEVTVYPVLERAEDLVFLANQNAIELHVPTARAASLATPDRLVVDLDPPRGETALVRRAAHLVRERLAGFGLETYPVATGSKGFHVVASILPTVPAEQLAVALQQLGALLEKEHPETLTTAFRIAERGRRVFVDWLRNRTLATVVSPWSLRARPRAPVATPLAWSEVDTVAPDGFGMDDVEALLDREDPLAQATPSDAAPFVASVHAAFEAAGLVLVPFDRFRS